MKSQSVYSKLIHITLSPDQILPHRKHISPKTIIVIYLENVIAK